MAWCRMSAFSVQNKRDEVGNKLLCLVHLVVQFVSVLVCLRFSLCLFTGGGLLNVTDVCCLRKFNASTSPRRSRSAGKVQKVGPERGPVLLRDWQLRGQSEARIPPTLHPSGQWYFCSALAQRPPVIKQGTIKCHNIRNKMITWYWGDAFPLCSTFILLSKNFNRAFLLGVRCQFLRLLR